MATKDMINWGRYRGWNGPFYRGKHKYVIPGNPTEDHRIVAVTTATEGGRYDAINMYDGQIISSGLIQVVERAQYSVSRMLSKTLPYALKELTPAMELTNSIFKANNRKRWRFFFKDARGEVDRESEQRQLMHGRSTGAIGTWDEESTDIGKTWAAAVASVWEHEEAQMAQVEFSTRIIRQYAFWASKKAIEEAPSTDVGRAFVAAYLSFAVNNPTRANKHLGIAKKSYNGPMWTQGWLIHVLKELTFGPRVAIYPHRYNAIRPVLEQLYNINLPDLADELKVWKESNDYDHLLSTEELQKALIALGYDLGPWGADGKYGPKTREAMLLFEQRAGVLPEYQDGMLDHHSYHALVDCLSAEGITL